MKLQPVVDKAVYAYAGQNASPTIRSRARVLAADAIRKYDPKVGAALPSFVYGHLRQLTSLAPKINDPLPVPDQMRRDRGLIIKARQQLEEQLGREPDDSEVSEIAGIPLKRVMKVQRMVRRGIPLSVLDSNNEDDDVDAANSIVGSERTPEDDWFEAVDYDLSPIDRKILRYRTGYDDHEQLPNIEIARRLGMSPAAVTQRAAKIQQRLDSYHG
jgi:DNA-directed RNA polymerase specialized sigma subunit